MRSRAGVRVGWYAVVVGATSLCAAISGCASELGCDLHGVTRKLGGVGLMDCGLGEQDNTSVVDRCAVNAFTARLTFRALYERSDGSLEAIVHGAGGHYYALRAAADGDAVQQADCEGAEIVTDGSRKYVRCEGRGDFEPACD